MRCVLALLYESLLLLLTNCNFRNFQNFHNTNLCMVWFSYHQNRRRRKAKESPLNIPPQSLTTQQKIKLSLDFLLWIVCFKGMDLDTKTRHIPKEKPRNERIENGDLSDNAEPLVIAFCVILLKSEQQIQRAHKDKTRINIV